MLTPLIPDGQLLLEYKKSLIARLTIMPRDQGPGFALRQLQVLVL